MDNISAEVQLMLNRAKQTGHYPVVEWILKSYLPWQALQSKEVQKEVWAEEID